jgi:adenosylcobinamide kinase / adenosylcobinamide-phosphate guanylyltransferase
MGKMANVILITGGSRSGKSRMALTLAQGLEPKIFVATAEPLDAEMEERILLHRQERGEAWVTIEEPVHLERVFAEYPEGVLVVDCLTLWLSNMLEQALPPGQILEKAAAWIKTARQRHNTTILVTNELGMGLVPATALGRIFRDLCGILNQQVAGSADRVLFVVSGLPIYLK